MRWAGQAVAVGALAFVAWRLGSGPFLDGVRAIDAGALAAAAAIFLLTTFCCAWRWRIVAKGLGVDVSLPAAVAAYYRCLFLNLTLPGGVAGDVHRGVSHGRDSGDVGLAMRAVVWERTAGQLVQVALTVAVLFVAPSPCGPRCRSWPPGSPQRRWSSFSSFAATGKAVLRDGGARRTTVRSDIRGGLLHKRALPAVVALSVIAVLGHALTLLVAARAVGVTAPVSQLLPLAFIAMMAMALPNIGGWGPREGVTAWTFSAAGLGAGLGAATAVAYGVMVLAASLPGGLVLAGEWLSRRRASMPHTQGRLPDTSYAR